MNEDPIQLPNASARHLVSQLRDAAQATGWDSLLQDAEGIQGLLEAPTPMGLATTSGDVLGTGPVDLFLAALQDDPRRTYHVHIQEALLFLDRPTVALILAFLQSKVDSDNTRRAYARHLKEGFKIMGLASLAELGAAHLVRYRENLMGDGRGEASHAQALYAVRSFFDWCADVAGLPLPARTVTQLLRVPHVEVLRPFVTASIREVVLLLEDAGLRDQALVLVMAGGGLRVSEVEHLDCADLLDVDGEGALWVRKGKGQKDRIVPVDDEVVLAVHRYLAAGSRRVDTKGPLFLAADRGLEARGDDARLSHYGIRKALGRLVKIVAIAKRITPHALRHTFGIEFQRRSKDSRKTAKVLGHATERPTWRYTDHLELKELRANLPHYRGADPTPEK